MKANRKLSLALFIFLFSVMLSPLRAQADTATLEMGSGDGWKVEAQVDAETYQIQAVTATITSQEGMDAFQSEYSSVKSPYASVLTDMVIGAEITKINGMAADGLKKLTNVSVAADNAAYQSEDNAIYTADGTELVLCLTGDQTEITVKDSVTRIGSYAFINNTGLKKVSAGAITTVDFKAFYGCSNLEELQLESLKRLGSSAFYGCKSLAKVTITDEASNCVAQDNVIYSTDGKQLILYPAALSGQVELPDTVKIIGGSAFAGNQKLTKVTAGALSYVGSWAFQNCTSLTEFAAQSLGAVGQNGFYGCTALENVNIEEADSIKTLGPSAFGDCTALKSFPYLSGVTDMQISVFSRCISLEEITLPAQITEIPNGMFSGCKSLKEITIPASVTKLEYGAFRDCASLGKITFLPETPPEIGDEALDGIPADVSITVPTGTEETYITALGEDYRENILATGVTKYALYVNGVQLRSDALTVSCGTGEAVYDPETKTLTLNNAEVTEGVNKYAYGGCINSGIDDLTIKIVGENTITSVYDGISSAVGCNVSLVGNGTLTLEISTEMDPQASGMYIGYGTDPTHQYAGDLLIDGPAVISNRPIQANHDITIQNATVTAENRLYSNQAGIVKIGEDADVTVTSVGFGNTSENDMKLVLDGGSLTIKAPENAGTVKQVVNFTPDSYGYIDLKSGTIVIEKTAAEGEAISNCPADQITIAEAFGLTVEEFLKGNVNSTTLSEEDQELKEKEKADKAKADAVKAAVEAIEKIEKTTAQLDALKEAIEAADKAVAALENDEQKELAKDAIASLNDAKGTYDDLVAQKAAEEKAKEEKEQADKAKADAVKAAVEVIEKIEKTTAQLDALKEAIGAADEAGAALENDEQKELAKDAIASLNDAKETYDDLVAQKAAEEKAKEEKEQGSGTGNTGTGGEAATVPDADSLEVIEKLICSVTGNKDVAGSDFITLQAKASKTAKSSVKLTWKKVSGAVTYVVYGNKAASGSAFEKLGTVTGTSFTQQKLVKGTYYKYVVVAVDGSGKVLSISKNVYAATTGGKNGNPKTVTTKAKGNKVSLKAKKSFKLGAKATAAKKQKIKKFRALSYESSNGAVATVSKKGVIKAVGKGKCIVYVYAQNGLSKKIKITVK